MRRVAQLYICARNPMPAAAGNRPTLSWSADVCSSMGRGVASHNSHAVVAVCRSRDTHRLGTTCVGGTIAANKRCSFYRAGCAIHSSSSWAPWSGDSALGFLLSLALLTVVGLGNLQQAVIRPSAVATSLFHRTGARLRQSRASSAC